MRPRLLRCGLLRIGENFRPKHRRFAADAGADMLGFIHVPNTARGIRDPRPSLPDLENAAVSLLREVARRLR